MTQLCEHAKNRANSKSNLQQSERGVIISKQNPVVHTSSTHSIASNFYYLPFLRNHEISPRSSYPSSIHSWILHTSKIHKAPNTDTTSPCGEESKVPTYLIRAFIDDIQCRFIVARNDSDPRSQWSAFGTIGRSPWVTLLSALLCGHFGILRVHAPRAVWMLQWNLWGLSHRRWCGTCSILLV